LVSLHLFQMHSFIETLIHFPILALFLAIGIGYLLGEISFFGFRFGIAGVLFAGLAIGALDPGIALPEILPTLGLILFVYMVGLQSGPALVKSIRERGYRDSAFAVAILTFGAAIALGCSWLLRLSGPRAAGLFCGATTNTPALAAARETVREIASKSGMTADQVKALADQPVVQYSIAYPVGVIGVLLLFQLMRKLWRVRTVETRPAEGILVRDFVVRNPAVSGRTLASVWATTSAPFAVSRIQHAGRTAVATPDTTLELGAIVSVVAESEGQREAASLFGESSPLRIEGDNSRIEAKRVYVSSPSAVGCTVAELGLDQFPAIISRIRRGDIEIVATPDSRLEYGDLLRVITDRHRISDVRQFFGDSIRGAAEAHFGSIALGMVAGVLLGMIPAPLPNGATLKLGYAGGPLIVALILGKLGRTGRITWVIPAGANITLRQIGLLLFLGGVGTRAGWEFLRTLQNNGLPTLLAGAAITLGVTLATLVFGHKLLKMPFDFVTGVMSGIQTQPACLAFAAGQARNDDPNVGYAAVYPAATISKIILAQLLVTLVPLAKAGDAVPATLTAPVRKRPRPVAAKLIRPGISGIASIPAPGGCLVAEGYSREANAAGVETTGMTGFYECAVTRHFAIFAAPGHWTANRGLLGMGDVSFGPKFVFNRESRLVPLFALGYTYKQPTAASGLGSGFHDHKVTAYADKSVGLTRVSANFIVKWEGRNGGALRQQMQSLGLFRPLRGRLGLAVQSFYSESPIVDYGGALAAAVYNVSPDLSTHAGFEHGFGPKSANLGVVLGMTYIYRGPARKKG
jgi:putative transport protein